MDDRRVRILPPLYLASATTSCWKCGADMPVVALIAPNVPDEEGSVCILSNVTELPGSVLSYIQKGVPTFKLKSSKTTGSEYYANTCPECGVLAGDFYVHCEPDSPLWPQPEEEAARVAIEEIPIPGPVEVEAEIGIGVGAFILEYGTWRGAKK